MKTIIVEILESELERLSKHRVVHKDVAVRSFISSGDVADLHEYEFDQVLECCLEAIENNLAGVSYDIELGRSPQTDERTYTLMNVGVDEDSEWPDIRTSDLLDAIENYKF